MSWTDPSDKQQGFKKDFNLQGGPNPYVLQRKTGAEQLQEAIKSVAQVMQQQKDDRAYQVLLNSQAPQYYQDMVAKGVPAKMVWAEYQNDISAKESDKQQGLADQMMQAKLQAAGLTNEQKQWDLQQSYAGNADQPETTTDAQGRQWRKGAGGHWYPMSATKQVDPTAQALKQQFGNRYAPADFNPDTVTIQPPAEGDTFDTPSQVVTGTGKKMSLPDFQKGVKLTGQTPGGAAPAQDAPDAAQQGPQVGEKRTINGVPAVWDGQGWLPAQ